MDKYNYQSISNNNKQNINQNRRTLNENENIRKKKNNSFNTIPNFKINIFINNKTMKLKTKNDKLNKKIFKCDCPTNVLLIIGISILLFPIVISLDSKSKLIKLYYNSRIILTIKGNGTQKILNNNQLPDYIYINGILQNITKVNEVTNLTKEENIITIEWISSLTSCSWMFCGLSNIIKIDASKFDASKVVTMQSMFDRSSSLVSLDLRGFDTSSVTSLECMFCGCSSLTSLNLNSFNTSLVTSFYKMFEQCKSLEILDISNFQINSGSSFGLMFGYCKSSLIICLDEAKAKNISNELLSGYQNNCEEVHSRLNLTKKIFEKNIYVNNCKDDLKYKYDYNNTCYEACPENTYYNKIQCLDNANELYFSDDYEYNIKNYTSIDEMILYIKNEILNGDLLLNLIKGNKTILSKKDNNVIYSISYLDNQEENNFNVTIVEIGKCENILREKYNLTHNDSLFLFKIEYFEEGLYFPIIQFHLFASKIKEELNMDLCKDAEINMFVPVSINEENLFKHDPSSSYFHDICFSYTTVDNTDINIQDRKFEFNNNKMSLCQSGCSYKSYNSTTKKVTCECQFNSTKFLFSEITQNMDEIINKFKDIKKLSNIGIIKCYYTLFTKNGFQSNIGSYVLIVMVFIELILMILFIFKGFYKFKNIIDKIIINEEEKENMKYIDSNINNKKKEKDKMKKKKTNVEIKSPEKHNNPPKIKRIKTKSNFIKIDNKNLNLKNIQITNAINSSKKESIDNLGLDINYKEKREKMNIIVKYNDFELNTVPYQVALKIDKRQYPQYYLSLLKYNQLLIFTFYTSNDYNSKLIKLSLFFFLFSLHYTVNALFFNNSTIHTIYINKGAYDFICQIPQILYSSFICSVIKIIISYFSLTEKNVIKIKKEKKNKNTKKVQLFKCLIIKFLLFYILTYISLIIFWYYLACFCAVFKNSQIHLIKDTLISFLLSQLYPFGLCLLPCIFRLIALRAERKDKEFLYKFSIFLQLI